jgi:Bacterial mobilisation protein (MobC)/Ribbon-helix-helix protein, copG family
MATKTPTIKNKDHKISLRLDAKEYNIFQEKLRKSNITISEFIRKAISSTTVVAKMTEEEIKLLRMLVGISTNLNQLAHKANAQIEIINLAIQMQSTRREIDSIIEKFR